MALPTERSYIEKAESILGKKLPSWLVERLLNENGGEIVTDDDDWQLFSVLDNRDAKHLKRSAMQIITETQTAKTWEDFPQDAIAIAENGMGDRLILLPEDEQSFGETVYLWEHDSDYESIEDLAVVEIDL